ncbi:MBL fold metallo-hydrolase [Microbacterium sp. LWH3-1.2]|uniref:MBL fold metallo-hydrolase n=1 Tax=Microbacterium sp. LWH3-1.2 TaxID=3135256 RepID=UPI003413407F
MILTKFNHATVRFEKDGVSLVTDPGTPTPESEELLSSAAAVLVTHEHFDHCDADALRRGLDRNPDLQVYGPAPVAELVGDHSDRFTEVSPGESFTIGPFFVETFGGTHAVIHPEMPEMSNISYLIEGRVYHPGDSYELPGVPVETLLMPTSGPWTSIRQGIDFVRGVAPTRAYQIHEFELSEPGQEYALYFLNLIAQSAPITKLAVGDSIEV